MRNDADPVRGRPYRLNGQNGKGVSRGGGDSRPAATVRLPVPPGLETKLEVGRGHRPVVANLSRNRPSPAISGQYRRISFQSPVRGRNGQFRSVGGSRGPRRPRSHTGTGPLAGRIV